MYFSNLECYPYSIYINWEPQQNGNILYNDKKFVTLLYQWHNDYLADYSKVSDAGSFVKSSIYDFIDDADKVVMAVDCENSDPYRLCATLKGLDADVTAKIHKIMLFDDVHTVDAWRILESHTKIPVEHIMTERVKQTKSLRVDSHDLPGALPQPGGQLHHRIQRLRLLGTDLHAPESKVPGYDRAREVRPGHEGGTGQQWHLLLLH